MNATLTRRTTTTYTLALVPCARCGRLCAPEALQHVAEARQWVCRDRHACWFAARANARIAAQLRAEGEEEVA